MYYEGIDEAVSRLSRSVAIVDNKLLYIQEVFGTGGTITLNVFDLPIKVGSRAHSIPLGKVSSLFNLGYANLVKSETSVYVARDPARHHRQGLSHNNVSIISSNGHNDGRWSFESLVTDPRYSEDMYKMLTNVYPTFSEAIDTVKSGKSSVWAFHPHLAVGIDDFRGDFVLHYSGKPVGWGDGARYTLSRRHKHLYETFSEVGVQIVK